jgi:methyl-accepting chemotaxis protein
MKWLKNLSTAKKITVLIVCSILFISGVGFTGFLYMNKMTHLAHEVYSDRLVPIRELNDIRYYNFINKDLTYELIISETKTEQDQYQNQIQKNLEDISVRLEHIQKILHTDAEKEIWSQVLTKIQELREARTNALKFLDEKNKEAAQVAFNNEYVPVMKDINELLNKLVEINVDEAEYIEDEISERKATATIMIVTISVLSVALFLFIGLLITRILTKPIQEIVALMNKAETGDLTVHIDYEAKDELGGLANSFNQMIEGVKETVVQVSEHARSLAASSEEISASTEEIANGAQEQARAAMASSEMMNEMANAVQDISKNAEGAAEATEQTVAAAEQGKKAIEEVLQGMNEISVRIHDLADKSTQIGEIIEVIDDIAEQTNLLALNAAIEAARAGEAGKGFAVVADEVRKLAERSGKATKEISELIESIQENTASSVAAVNAGNEKTNNAGVMFEDIVKHVKQSSKRVVEILAASEEGASQSQEVLRAVESIASVSEETAASVEQTAATANDLAKMAEMLNHLAEKFKVMK